MSFTKTLAAAALAFTVTASDARAGMDPVTENNYGLLIGAAIAGLVALFVIATASDGDSGILSTKDINGTDGKPLPGSPSVARTQVVQDF